MSGFTLFFVASWFGEALWDPAGLGWEAGGIVAVCVCCVAVVDRVCGEAPVPTSLVVLGMTCMAGWVPMGIRVSRCTLAGVSLVFVCRLICGCGDLCLFVGASWSCCGDVFGGVSVIAFSCGLCAGSVLRVCCRGIPAEKE